MTHRVQDDGLPYARIEKPENLFDDGHLQATGGVGPMVLPDGPHAGETTQVPLFTLRIDDGERLLIRNDPPRFAEHTQSVLAALGCSNAGLDSLSRAGVARFEST